MIETQREVFRVRVPDEGERKFDLDQLDAAYKAGLIDERTLVQPAGSFGWITLAELAGLDVPEEAPSSIAPFAVDGVDVDVDVERDPGSHSVLSSREINAALRPRRGGKLVGFAIALVVIGGLGFAATRARPGLATSITARVTKLASRSEPARAAAMAPATPPPVEPPKAPEAKTEAKPTTTTTKASDLKPAMPTTALGALPDAKPAKPTKKTRR
jgi:hypothetical protein